MIENGSWAPMSGKIMRGYLERMKNVEIVPTTVTIKSTMSEENLSALHQLADEILA